MSNKDKTSKTAEDGVILDTEPVVASKPKFVFADYREDAGSIDKSRVDDYVTDQFDADEYHLAWIRHDSIDKATTRRYFEIVRRDTHGHLFKDDAFDPILGVIGRGKEHLHPTMGGIPELYLCIRPAEANVEEQRQMSTASGRRLKEDGRIKALREKMGSVVGTDMFGGVSMNRSGWEL